MTKKFNNNKKKITLMAWKGSVESQEEVRFKSYIGVAPLHYVTVNPSMKELQAMYPKANIDKEPDYLTEVAVDRNDPASEKIKQARVEFVMKSDPKCGYEFNTRITFFINKSFRTSQKGTMQVINVYGETTWLTPENIKAGVVPEDLNWFDKTGMRPCYVGEEDLTNFLRTFLCIPSRSYMNKKTGERVVIKDPSMAEGRLEYPEKLFAGDMSEVKQIMTFQPNNLIKAMLGVRTTDDNKQYQAVYTKKFLKNGATDYTSLAKNLESSRNAGMYSNVEFLAEPVREFSNTPTDFPADSQEKQPENNASKWSKAFNKEATK